MLSSGRTTFATDIRIAILPGTNNNNKRFRRKRSLVDVRKKVKSFRESPFGHPFFGKSVLNNNPGTGSSWSRNRHRLAQTSFIPDPQDPFQFDVYNDSLSEHFSSGLHFPFDEVLSQSSYNKLYQEATQVPSMETTRNSISIRPSAMPSATASPPTNRRTIVPYNYLDEIWDPEDYTLQIKYTKRSDAGTYICQVIESKTKNNAAFFIIYSFFSGRLIRNLE